MIFNILFGGGGGGGALVVFFFFFFFFFVWGGGGGERCCCFSLSFFFVLFGFDLITTLMNISIISQHSPFKIKRPRAIQKNFHCTLQEHC